jgi:tryptophan synthase alpha chain
VIGAALMRRVLDGATPAEVGHEVAGLRAALDRFNAALDQSDQEAPDFHEEAPAGTAHAEVSGDRG